MTQKIIFTVTDKKITVDYQPRLPTITEFAKLTDRRKKLLAVCDSIVRKAIYIYNSKREI